VKVPADFPARTPSPKTLGASGGRHSRQIVLKTNGGNDSERAEQEKYQSEICCKKSENFT
jgi:hypothetical protein